MKQKRIRVDAETLANEKRNILSFVMDEVSPCDGGVVFISEMFEAYKAYRSKHFLDATKLSIDGFGRLFPKNFERAYKTVRKFKRGHAVLNVKL